MNAIRCNLIAALAVILFFVSSVPDVFASTVIAIDPGPVGSLFASKQIPFNDLNGVGATGQILDLEFQFPAGVDAVYRLLPGGRDAYGWSLNLTFTGGNTVTANPQAMLTVAVDAVGNSVALPPGSGSIGTGSSGFMGFFGNYNTLFTLQQLIDFTDVPYHGVRMQFRLPDFAENVVISSASFRFDTRTVSGVGDRTEIIAAVPEPSSAVLLALISIPVLARRRRV